MAETDQIMVHAFINVPAFDLEPGEEGLIDADFAAPLLELECLALVTPDPPAGKGKAAPADPPADQLV